MYERDNAREKLHLPNKARVEVRKFDVQHEARPQQPRPQRRKEGHDDLINRLRMRSTITITTIEGPVIYGILQESDRYTITVRQPKEGEPVESAIREPQKILLVYKHAIESFYLTKLALDE